MRVRFVGGFGAIGITGENCPAGGSWDAWCNCMYPAGASPDLNAKCKSRPFPGGWVAPWTDVGAAARGLPKEGIIAQAAGVVLNVAGGSNATTGTTGGPGQTVTATVVPPAMVEAAPEPGTLAGIPMTALAVGAAAVVGGVLLLGRRKGRRR